MSTTKYEIRAGAYYDSVVLMQLQKGLAALPGVEDAGVVMATPANKEVLTAAGFDLARIAAQSDDLLIIVRGNSAESAADALAQVDDLLKPKQSSDGGVAYRPKSLATANKMLPSCRMGAHLRAGSLRSPGRRRCTRSGQKCLPLQRQRQFG